MRFNIHFDVKVGKFIRRFIMADMLLFGGWGLIDPLFSVFLVNKIAGATLVTVGILAAIHWFLKSSIQIPIATFLDKSDGERADFYALLASLVIVGAAAFLLTSATRVWHVYLIQVLKAIGFGLYVPAWSSLFSHHLDKGHYSLDWSLDSTAVGYAMGVTGLLGGILVTWLGYNVLFVAVGILCFLAAALFLTLPQLVLPEPTGVESVIRDHVPVNINQ